MMLVARGGSVRGGAAEQYTGQVAINVRISRNPASVFFFSNQISVELQPAPENDEIYSSRIVTNNTASRNLLFDFVGIFVHWQFPGMIMCDTHSVGDYKFIG